MLKRIVKRGLCEWTPNIPKNKIVLNKDSYRAPHPVWEMKEAEKVKFTHLQPKTVRDRIAYYMMKALRKTFDVVTQYKPGQMNESQYLKRCIFLETVAGVPGMIGGMMRHFEALRFLREDGGWIHHLLEEAENERMHLLTFLKLKQPSVFERLAIMSGQLVFIIYYGLMYLISSKMAHRFVGYLEEEAVKTYTSLIQDVDEGRLPKWKEAPAAEDAIRYWALAPDAKLRDVFVAIRADEVAHREFNHHFADMGKNEPMVKHELHVREDSKKPIDWSDNIETKLNSKI
jgi:hypothetical protein